MEKLKQSKYPAFGLDIGTYSIKVAGLDHKTDTSRLHGISAVSLPNPGKTITEQNKSEIAKRLKEAVKSAKPRRIKNRFVVSALPESKVFSAVIEVPEMPEEQLENTINFEAGKSMPVSKDELYIDYLILNRKKEGRIEILIVGAERNLVEFYLEIIRNAGFELIILETKPIAALRALILPNDKTTKLSVDIGAKNSSITLAINGKFRHSVTLPIGGDKYVETVMKDMKIDRKKALETLEKRRSKKENEEEIMRILFPLFEEIKNKISEAVNFWGEKTKGTLLIENILLSGGGSVTPGLAEYIGNEIGIKTEVGNPLINISQESVKNIDRGRIMSFTTALGLALRRIEKI